MPPCINTTVEGKGTRVKKRRGRRGKEKRKKEREKDKPALPIRCLPIKRVAAIDFEGGRTSESHTFLSPPRFTRTKGAIGPRRQDSHAYGLRRSTSRQGARIRNHVGAQANHVYSGTCIYRGDIRREKLCDFIYICMYISKGRRRPGGGCDSESVISFVFRCGGQ